MHSAFNTHPATEGEFGPSRAGLHIPHYSTTLPILIQVGTGHICYHETCALGLGSGCVRNKEDRRSLEEDRRKRINMFYTN